MDLILGNPAGLWALLGLPAVLAIHLLQHQVRTRYASTLFLLDELAMTGIRGSVIDRIRHSRPLWLQLLAVLLLTWLLIQPRWLREDSFQRVVVVLDSSLSMHAFLDRLWPGLGPHLRELSRTAALTEFILVESDPTAATLYAGPDLARLRDALTAWRPRLGHHDTIPALRMAQNLGGSGGIVLFLSDRLPEEPISGIAAIAIGERIENCGFAGLRVEGHGPEAEWQAVVRNYSEGAVRRAWWVEAEGGRNESRLLELGPGESRVLRGGFPPGADFVTVCLEPDAFPVDDRLPVVRPAPKRLEIEVAVDAAIRPLVQRLVGTLDAAEPAQAGLRPDLEFLSYRAPALPGLRANAVCFPRPLDDARVPLDGWVTTENHRLLQGLNWHGLLVDHAAPTVVQDRDEVLVRRGEKPLILLRTGESGRQLIFAFDPLASNAPQWPAFVLLVHRFAEELRAEKRAPTSVNVDLRQRLRAPVDPDGPPVMVRTIAHDGENEEEVPVARAALLRAPDRPAHFTVRQGNRDWLRGAARFADLREADFSRAASGGSVRERAREQARLNSRPDALTLLWMLLLVGLLLWSWWPAKGEAA